MSEVLDLPKVIIQNEERVIFAGQETDLALYILEGKVQNEDSFPLDNSYYQTGEVVCIRGFFGLENIFKKS